MRTRVKICGITRRQDAEFAVNIGADALGLVFYRPSPRAVTIEAARTIVAQLPPFVSLVGLFVDAHAEEVNACLDALPIDILQFHGDEPAAYCQQFNRPYLKAIRMRDGIDLHQQSAVYSSAAGLLLDTYQPGVPGGTGQVFDWSMIGQSTKPIVLAGGLDIGNVASAIRKVRPYAVDVSGGVELEKGIKSHQKISAFMQEVANA